MPVAHVITHSPQDCDELCRQLAAAGYTIQFARPDEEFDPGDLVVAAASVHRDYALQYAAEVAQESNADVIVAPGVAPGSFEPSVAPPDFGAAVVSRSEEQVADASAVSAESSEPLLTPVIASLGSRWRAFREQRDLAREQRRLERERRELHAEERRRDELRARAEEEARVSAERERLRLQRQAEVKQMRRAAELERQRVAEEQARVAAERERLRLQRQAEEEERRRADETERVRVAELAARIEAERRREEEQRRVLDVTPAPAPIQPEYVSPIAVAAQLPPAEARASVAPRRAVAVRPRIVPHSRTPRQRTLQRAVLLASLVALFAMIGFALAMNVDSRAPLPNAVTNNPVQEESPFGPAHTAPQSTPAPVVPARAVVPTPQARPHASPTSETKPAAAVQAPRHVVRHTTRRPSNDVADDQVIVHHYGERKHPPASDTRASVPHYSDQQ